MKSEPHVFSFQDLLNSPCQTTSWEGVRNYQARNFMCAMRTGDRVLYYHSSTVPPGIVGLARVVREAQPDVLQFDTHSDYFDPKATHLKPRWFQVGLQADVVLPKFLPLQQLRQDAQLAGMVLLQKGSRLSVQSVSQPHWQHILKLADVPL